MITPEDLQHILENAGDYNSASIANALTYDKDQAVLSIAFNDIYSFNNSRYQRWLENRVNNTATYNSIINSMTLPLPTVEFMGSMAGKIYKIFNGEDQNITTTDNVNKQAYIDSQKKYGYEFWKNEGYQNFIEKPNSLAVCHYNEDGDYYVSIIGLEGVKAIEFDSFSSEITMIVFEEGEDKLYHCIDKNHYTQIELTDGGTYQYLQVNGEDSISAVIKEGVCPVSFISDKQLSVADKVARKNIYTESIGQIKEYLALKLMRNNIDNFQFPVRLKYGHEPCKTKFNDNTYCHGGYVHVTPENSTEKYAVYVNNMVKPCPVCNSDTGEGFTGTITRRAPVTNEDADILDRSITYLTLDPSAVDSMDKRISDLEQEVSDYIVGVDDNANDNQQHNKERVLSVVDGKKQKIMYWKSPFEKIIKFSNDLMIEHYFPNQGIEAIVNLGTDFFLSSVNDYLEIGKKQIELSDRLTDWRRAIICRENESNEYEKNRQLKFLAIKEHSKPYFNKTQSSVDENYKSDKIDWQTYDLYSNFDALLFKFEDQLGDSVNIISVEDSKLIEQFDKFVVNYYANKKINTGSNEQGSESRTEE